MLLADDNFSKLRCGELEGTIVSTGSTRGWPRAGFLSLRFAGLASAGWQWGSCNAALFSAVRLFCPACSRLVRHGAAWMRKLACGGACRPYNKGSNLAERTHWHWPSFLPLSSLSTETLRCCTLLISRSCALRYLFGCAFACDADASDFSDTLEGCDITSGTELVFFPLNDNANVTKMGGSHWSVRATKAKGTIRLASAEIRQ